MTVNRISLLICTDFKPIHVPELETNAQDFERHAGGRDIRGGWDGSKELQVVQTQLRNDVAAGNEELISLKWEGQDGKQEAAGAGGM